VERSLIEQKLGFLLRRANLRCSMRMCSDTRGAFLIVRRLITC
jgi:hypothetical protein